MSEHRFISVEEIIHIAIEMGIVADVGYVHGEGEIDINDIVSFAKRIETVARADEREACAKECEERPRSSLRFLCECADAIRARGNNEPT